HDGTAYPSDCCRRPTFPLLALVPAVLTACGGDGGNGTPEHLATPITVAVSDASGTWQPGTTIQMTATVSNDLGNRGVSWGVSCPTPPCGSVSPATTASGATATYTAPAARPPTPLPVTT